MVLTVDATPDTRELECNEIKTQVELATGQLGLRRATQEHSFPRMLHQVGLSTSQPGSRPAKAARISASPRGKGSQLSKKEASRAGAGELTSPHWSSVGRTTMCCVRFCNNSSVFGGGGLIWLKWPSISASNIPQSLPFRENGASATGEASPLENSLE